MIGSLTTIFISLILGFSFLKLIKVKNLFWPEVLGLSFGLGIGFLTLIVYYLNILGLKFTFLNIGLPIIFVTLILVYKLLRQTRFNMKRLANYFRSYQKTFLQLTLLEKILIVLLILLFVFIVFRAIHWPVFYWDAVALYDFRAKAWLFDGSIYKTAVTYNYPAHPYPPLTSLAHLFSYILGADNPKLIYPAFYFSLLVSFFATTVRFSGRLSALLFTFLLATTYFFVEFASGEYTNLPYAYYLSLGFIYLYSVTAGFNQRFLIISGVLLGFSGFVRATGEPFIIAAALIFGLFLIVAKKPKLQILWLVVPYVAITASWQLYLKFVLNTAPVPIDVPQLISQNPFILSEVLAPSNLLKISKVLAETVNNTFGEIFITAAVATFIFAKRVKTHFFLFSLILINLIFFLVASFVFSFVWPTWETLIRNSANRLMMFFVPLLLLYLAVLPGKRVFSNLEKILRTLDSQILKIIKIFIPFLLFTLVLEKKKNV